MTKRIISKAGKDLKNQGTLFKDQYKGIGEDSPTVVASGTDIKKSLVMARKEYVELFCRVRGRRDLLLIQLVNDMDLVLVWEFEPVRSKGGKTVKIVDGSSRLVCVSDIIWIERRAITVLHSF